MKFRAVSLLAVVAVGGVPLLAACSTAPGSGSAQARSGSPAPGTASSGPVPSGQASGSPVASGSGSPAPVASASRSSASPGSSTCKASSLDISITHSGSVTGQVGGYLTFTNKGSGSCQLSGWPDVTGIPKSGGRGQASKLAHAQSTMFGAWQYTSPMPVVTLAPGKSAYAVVAASDQPVGSATSCPAPYASLRVTAPGSSTPTTVSAWLPGANTDLPSCPNATGKSSAEISDIVPPSSLPG
ncbi:MAG: DUF4232 domain-containing protein [Nocardiopsaceae bacterium]|nr:DUF4232 domain-containing protein [Nocardiopsaceae bacterium]